MRETTILRLGEEKHVGQLRLNVDQPGRRLEILKVQRIQLVIQIPVLGHTDIAEQLVSDARLPAGRYTPAVEYIVNFPGGCVCRVVGPEQESVSLHTELLVFRDLFEDQLVAQIVVAWRAGSESIFFLQALARPSARHRAGWSPLA